ncbi:MAG: membrane protein insertase YidC [Williamsia sp.]|nr:membrane protein insertase YidC [Williamsia sp.]
MGMDRNTVIGFVLLGVLLFLYLYLSTKNSQELAVQRKHVEDSIALVNAKNNQQFNAARDSAAKTVVVKDTTPFQKVLHGSEELVTVENNLMRIVFTNRGAQPKQVFLKKYQSYDSTQVNLVGGNDRISYAINTDPGQAAQVSDLYFAPSPVVKNGDGTQVISFQINGANGKQLVHRYTIRPDDYAIDWDVVTNGADKFFSQEKMNLHWQAQPLKKQRDVSYERLGSSICFYEDGKFDYISSKTAHNFENPVQWVAISQQFFNTILLAKNNFSSGEVNWTKETADTSNLIAKVEVDLHAKIPAGTNSQVAMQLYYGPNDYYILKKQAPGMDRIVNLGRDMYSFVRPINVYVIMPVFNFFKSFISSYGIVILLLTLFIRLLTSPLVYKSYLSGAKMKALRPEMDTLKKKYGDDQQAYGMEQMKLFREAGVNPLGGCIPALLQIPIFFSLYSFFNSNIALRGQHFLWSKDLSVYDSILNLSFNIPFYGSHVSLFTILAVATSFLISLYGMSNAPDQNNPAMKYMPYIFPVMLLGFFNKLPSALTWYYTVSNVITLIMQYVIQNYIINHDKILADIQENRKKPKTKSKWQERIEQMQETQQKMQQERIKSQGK